MKKTTGFKANEDTRIWCEYCRIFVYNNRINREKHDNSPQHQSNFKKKVETIRKEEQQKKRLQNDLFQIPSSGNKSFYSESPQNQQPLNLLNMKPATIEKKKILGLSSTEPKTSSKMTGINFDDEIKEISTIVDIKSVSSELKRKMKDDEKLVIEPKTEEPQSDDITLESLNMFKKKKAK